MVGALERYVKISPANSSCGPVRDPIAPTVSLDTQITEAAANGVLDFARECAPSAKARLPTRVADIDPSLVPADVPTSSPPAVSN